MASLDTKVLIRKWDKAIKIVESVKKAAMTAEMKQVLVHSLENTANRLAYREATNPGNIGQYKKYAVDLITAVIPNLIAFDIVAVQPLDNKSGMINVFNFNYGRGKGKTKAGDTFNSLNMGPSDTFYTSALVKDEVILKAGETVPASIELDWAPVKVGTFSIAIGSVIGVSDNFGNITFSDGTTGVITPSGVLNLAIAGSAAADDVVLNYRFDNTSVRGNGPERAGFSNHPEAELKIESIPVEAETRTMRAYWAFDAAYELSKEYGQDEHFNVLDKCA